MRHSLALIPLFALTFALTACGLFPTQDEAKEKTVPVEKMYADAVDDMENHNYEKAVKSFEALQSHYPYGRYAQQAQLEIAYANFKQKEPEAALAAAESFIKQYPRNPHVDYAYYLKGLINFNEDLGLLGAVVSPDLSARDPNAARDAFDSFKELVTRFPDSKYAPDSRVRMQYLINALARHEIHVADYYLRRGAYVAAANRAKGVLVDYAQTPATRDALQIMVQSYDALGMKDLRDDAERVLAANVAKDGRAAPAVRESPQNAKSWWQFWK
jgi:outer membrane protein assembly factor BamD